MPESVIVGFDMKRAGPAAHRTCVAAAENSGHLHLGVDICRPIPILGKAY
jgi:hypothetical protein